MIIPEFAHRCRFTCIQSEKMSHELDAGALSSMAARGKAMDDKGQRRLGIILLIGIALVAYLLYTPSPKGSCNSIMKFDGALVCLGYIKLNK
jgi:hypothetical protein